MEVKEEEIYIERNYASLKHLILIPCPDFYLMKSFAPQNARIFLLYITFISSRVFLLHVSTIVILTDLTIRHLTTELCKGTNKTKYLKSAIWREKFFQVKIFILDMNLHRSFEVGWDSNCGTAVSTVLYQPLMKDECESLVGWLSAGKTFVFGKKIWPNVLLPTINPTWKALESKWSLDGEKSSERPLELWSAPLSNYNATKGVLSLHRYDM